MKERLHRRHQFRPNQQTHQTFIGGETRCVHAGEPGVAPRDRIQFGGPVVQPAAKKGALVRRPRLHHKHDHVVALAAAGAALQTVRRRQRFPDHAAAVALGDTGVQVLRQHIAHTPVMHVLAGENQLPCHHAHQGQAQQGKSGPAAEDTQRGPQQGQQQRKSRSARSQPHLRADQPGILHMLLQQAQIGAELHHVAEAQSGKEFTGHDDVHGVDQQPEQGQ